jgi:hypothetical protein
LGSIRATVLDSAGAPVIGYDDYDPWGYPLALRTKAVHENNGYDDNYTRQGDSQL